MRLIDKLREAIDVQHAEALDALKTVSDYLEAKPLCSNRRTDVYGKVSRIVAGQFVEFRTVRSVADETGLTCKQVRGVIGRQDIRDNFTSKNGDGVRLYKFMGDILPDPVPDPVD